MVPQANSRFPARSRAETVIPFYHNSINQDLVSSLLALAQVLGVAYEVLVPGEVEALLEGDAFVSGEGLADIYGLPQQNASTFLIWGSRIYPPESQIVERINFPAAVGL